MTRTKTLRRQRRNSHHLTKNFTVSKGPQLSKTQLLMWLNLLAKVRVSSIKCSCFRFCSTKSKRSFKIVPA